MHMLADFALPSNWTKCCGDGSTISLKYNQTLLGDQLLLTH